MAPFSRVEDVDVTKNGIGWGKVFAGGGKVSFGQPKSTTVQFKYERLPNTYANAV